MDKVTGFETLKKIVEDDLRHKDYERVTDLADLYYKLFTGDGIDELLQQIVSRETGEEFAQRKRLTNSVIPPVVVSTKLPFQKVVRKKPKVRLIDWKTGDYEKNKEELELHIEKYWGDAGLEQYFEYAFVDYNYFDPNAFLITEFDAFNPKKEKAKPYPFVATSSQAIMFDIKNNIVDYLVVMLPVDEKLVKYTMYLGNDTIQFTEVEKKGDGEYIEIKGKYYQIDYFQPKNPKVPARRFGYRRDPQTSGRTFVSCFHDVVAYLKKMLKVDSELDISTAMTAFPQRFMYVSPCKERGCNKGTMPDGKLCVACDGSGKEPFHSSAADVITLDLPRDPEQIIDLEKLLVYKSPPIELLTFQKDFIAYLKNEVYLMMFNKELFSKTEVSQTATEKILETDNMNDTLKPFATALSTMWEFVVQDIATFTDLGKGLMAQHLFPDDFKFKNINELMSELKAARDASASTSTIAAIEDDMNEILYSDRPEELKAIRIKNSVNPFRGYNEADVRLIISQGKTTEYNAVLWANLESIFNDLENEQEVWIYDMATDKILDLVRGKTEEYMVKIKEQKPAMPSYDTEQGVL